MQQEINENLLNIPCFLRKLWRMVNNPKNDGIISWGSDETSFVIKNPLEFEYELLPMHYKHNNMSSFIRQLNLYGFHKIPSHTKDDKTMQFYHPYFQRDHPEYLKMISRKDSVPKVAANNKLSKLLSDVQQVQGRQQQIDNELVSIKKENAMLWRQLLILRQKHAKQQQIVNKLIQFLVSVIQTQSSDSSNIRVGTKRHLTLPGRFSKKPNLSTSKFLEDENDLAKKKLHDELNFDDFDYEDEDDEEDDILNEDDYPISSNKLSTLTFPSDGESSSSLKNDLDAAQITEVPLTFEVQNQGNQNNYIILSPAENTENDSENINPDIIINEVIENNSDINPVSVEPLEEIFSEKNIPTSKSSEQTMFFSPISKDVLISGINNNPVISIPEKSMQTKKPNVCDKKIVSSNYLDTLIQNTDNDLGQFEDILKNCEDLDSETLVGLFKDILPELNEETN